MGGRRGERRAKAAPSTCRARRRRRRARRRRRRRRRRPRRRRRRRCRAKTALGANECEPSPGTTAGQKPSGKRRKAGRSTAADPTATTTTMARSLGARCLALQPGRLRVRPTSDSAARPRCCRRLRGRRSGSRGRRPPTREACSARGCRGWWSS